MEDGMTTTSTLSRRTLVASTAALPALAVPVVAGTAPADPIFAAIELYRTCQAEFSALCDHDDHLEEIGQLVCAPDDHRSVEMVAQVERDIAARVALARTAPTTIEGLAAYLEFVVSEGKERSTVGEIDLTFQDDFNGVRECDLFLQSIAQSARSLAGEA
jgi:hypothetical protein